MQLNAVCPVIFRLPEGKKDLSNTTLETESLSGGGNGGDKNECRLINVRYDVGEHNYHYNRQGLADEWDISDFGIFKQEYNSKGRLTKSRLYIEGSLVYTIHFFYEKDKVVKEIWYEGNSSVIYDEVFYTFNHKGQNIRMESFLGDYYTVNTFDQAGNVLTWDFYIGGNLTYSNRNIFGHRLKFKNPARLSPV